MSTTQKPRVGISACLLGQEVRYDGAHKRHDWVVEVLAPQVSWLVICPELELGLGVPREPIQLVPAGPDTPPDAVDSDGLRLVGAHSKRELGPAMRAHAAARAEALAAENLSGYIFKSRSPSCGLAPKVKVYDYPGEDPPWEARGRGLFAAALVARLPDLPVVEERDLDDPAAQADFLRRLHAYHARHGQNA